MSKKNNLKDYLNDLYEGIASRKTYPSTNPQDFRSDIESIALPVAIATEEEMNALLENAEMGAIYKYTGTSGTYENGALYVVEVE